MNNSKSPIVKDEPSSNGRHFSESNQSAFRRISAVKSESTEKPTKNGSSISTDELLANKTTIPNPFLSPLITSSADFHSHLALLRPFLSQTLPFVPPIPPPSLWHSLPFLHPYLSTLRPPGLLPPPIPPISSSSVQPKASTSTPTNHKKSASTHYHQYTITNNNVLVPSSATLMDFIRRPGASSATTTNGQSTTSNPKSKNVKKYKCDICSRAFSRSNTLVTHKRIHTGEKPFVCEVCDRAFRQPGNLTRHKLTHTAAKPYACGICSRAFNRASNLHSHQRTHTGLMPTSAKSSTNDKNNNNLQHKNGHEDYTCRYCQEVFTHKLELSLHVAALHHSEVKSFGNNHDEGEDEDDDEEEDMEDEHISENTSEQNIDLLED